MAGEIREPVKKRAPRKAPAKVAEVEVFDPAYEAHRRRVGGMSWREVAENTGYPSEDACRLGVQAYLSKAAAQLNREQQAERLAVELDRLDALQAGFWAAAMLGDEKAAMVVLNVIRTRAKLLGLETKDTEAAAVKTIVIAGSQEEYVAGLKAVVEASQATG